MLDSAVAGRVRLLGLDVDGVLTDNAIFIAEVDGKRQEFKRFDIQDGLGIRLLQPLNIPVVLVSGRESDATVLRAKELGIDEVIQDAGARKVPAFSETLARHGIGWREVAYVGDDLADLPVLRRVGLPIAVANAVNEVKEMAAYVTGARGGHGAVREVIEMLLRARGMWEEAVGLYLAERDGDD